MRQEADDAIARADEAERKNKEARRPGAARAPR
jgi:hypothetical protein